MFLWKRLKKPDEEKAKELRENIRKEGGLEKNDFLAMMISAFIVIIPVCLVVLLLIYFLARLLFRI